MLLIKGPENRCEMGEEGRKLELGKNNEGMLSEKSVNRFIKWVSILLVGNLVSRLDLCVG